MDIIMNAFAGIRPKGGQNPTPLAFFPGVCSGGYLFSSGGPTPTTPPPIFTLLYCIYYCFLNEINGDGDGDMRSAPS